MIVRRFNSPEMAFDRLEELEIQNLAFIELQKLSNRGNYASVTKSKNGVRTWQSFLPHHAKPAANWIIKPRMLREDRKAKRRDIHARYGTTYISKNKELNHG